MEDEQKTITVIRDGMETKVNYKVTPVDVNCGDAAHMPNQMTDKELLEKAAKALGERMEWDGNGRYLLRPVPYRNFVHYEPWNPLTDDGDALRLAVKLRLDLHIDELGAMAVHFSGACEEDADGDHFAATRRAITRAAAAMAG